MTERQTVAGAYAKIDGHEELCAERYKNIHDAIGDLKDGMKWVIRLALALLLSITGWLAVQVWDGNKAEIARGQAIEARDRIEASQERMEARP